MSRWSSLCLHEEVVYPDLRPVDGAVVALVGDVVLVSRPCWLHVTREGLLDGAAALALRHPRSRSPRFNPKELWLGTYWRNVDLLRGGTLPYLLELLSRDFLLCTCFIHYCPNFTLQLNKSPRI